jgi:peptidoglycan hydrolase CwlO-like protein
MLSLKKMWIWVKTNWQLVLIILCVLSISTAYLASRYKTPKRALVTTNKVSILMKEMEIVRLESMKEYIDKCLVNLDLDIKQIDEKIAEKKTQISSIEQTNKKLSMQEKLEKFKQLGY